jgi:hypothetical protein
VQLLVAAAISRGPQIRRIYKRHGPSHDLKLEPMSRAIYERGHEIAAARGIIIAHAKSSSGATIRSAYC